MTQRAGYLGPFAVYNHICGDTSQQRGIGFADKLLAPCDLNAFVDREYILANAKQAFQDPSNSPRQACHKDWHRVIV
jgi:hypothetical protein